MFHRIRLYDNEQADDVEQTLEYNQTRASNQLVQMSNKSKKPTLCDQKSKTKQIFISYVQYIENSKSHRRKAAYSLIGRGLRIGNWY